MKIKNKKLNVSFGYSRKVSIFVLTIANRVAKYANRLEEKKAWDKRQREGVRKYQEKRKNKLLTVKKKSPVLKPIISRPKRVYKIKKVSKKESERLRAYHKQKREMMKDPANQICQWPGCEEPSTDCHHGKGRGGRYLLMKKWLKFLCRQHHIYAELHPEEAKEKGISFSRLD